MPVMMICEYEATSAGTMVCPRCGDKRQESVIRVCDDSPRIPVPVVACIHRGEEIARRPCPSCRGGELVKVFECEVQGECSIGKTIEDVACCATCPPEIRDLPAVSTRSGMRMFRASDKTVGRGLHRHGWPWVAEKIEEAVCGHESDVRVFDDFVERTFVYESRHRHTVPWVGVFHHPPDAPEWAGEGPSLDYLFSRPKFKSSLPHLRCAIALTEFLAVELRQRLDVPAVVARYPGPVDVPQWSIAAWRDNPDRELMQLGWYLRNTRLIYRVAEMDDIARVRYWPGAEVDWVQQWDASVWRCLEGEQVAIPPPTSLDRPLLSNAEYDAKLTKNVVCMELFSASANTVLVECIARGTPVIVNRHPAAVEYLGPDYPLYFDRPSTIPGLLTEARLQDASDYLLGMPREWLEPSQFTDTICEALALC